MVIFNTFELLRRMDHLIERRSTGTPAQFARRLGISVRTLYNYLSVMKETGAPIRFSHTDGTYEYTEDGRFTISFVHHTTESEITLTNEIVF